MANKISEQELANLAINLVKSPTAFTQMQNAGLIQSDEFYFVEGDEATTYSFQDFTAGRFIVSASKNGVVTPITVGTGSISGGSSIAADATVVGGVVPSSTNGYVLSVTKKTIKPGTGIVITASDTSNIGISLATVVTASNAGPSNGTTLTHGGSFTVPYITYDAYGRITAASNKTFTMPSETQLSVSGVGGDNGTVITGISVSNHQVTIARRAITAGNAITVSTSTSGQIIINHSGTGGAVTIASAAGKFINAISFDNYGHVTNVHTASETVLTNSNAVGAEKNKFIAGLAFSGHSIGVAKATVSAIDGLYLPEGNTVSSLSIGIASIAGLSTGTYGVSGKNNTQSNKTLTYSDRTFAVPYVTVNARGQVTAVGTNTVTIPNSVAISAATGSGADTTATVLGGISANGSQITVAKKTLSGVNGITVTPISNTGISIGITSLNVSVTSSTTDLSHGGTFTVPQTVTVNSLGQTTAIKNVQFKLPSETVLSVASNVTAGEEYLKVITGITVSNHQISLAKRTLSAGTGIALTSSSGTFNVALSTIAVTTSSGSATLSHGGTFTVSNVTRDSYGRVTNIASTTYTMPSETGLSGGSAAGNDCQVVVGVTGSGHALSVAKRTLTAGSGITITSGTNAITVGISTIANLAGSYGPNITGTDAAPTALAFGGKFIVPYVTIDSTGRVTAASSKYYQLPSQTSVAISGTGSDPNNATLISGISAGGTANHTLTIARKTIKAGTGIAIANTSADITISHKTTTATGLSANDNTGIFVRAVSIDSMGHVTAVNSGTETSVSITSGGNESLKFVTGITAAGTHNHTLTVAKKAIAVNTTGLEISEANSTVTISHKDTSSASNLTASGRRYVTGLTFDTYGHVTGYTTGTETVTDSDLDEKTMVSPQTATAWYKLTVAPMSAANSTASVSSTISGLYYNNNVSMHASTGTLRANIYRVQDKVELQYNSTTDALDFVFI